MHPDGFLNALRADPGDDTTRLVWADWLDEQGDAARAEFVRAQVRLETLDEDDPERLTLEARVRALLEEHERTWVGPVPDCVRGWTFRGGFLDEVVVHGTGRLEAAADLFARHPVREVVLKRAVDLEEVAGCETFRIVPELHVHRRLGPDDRAALHALLYSPHVAGLRRLRLLGDGIDLHAARLLAAAPLHQLRALELHGTNLVEVDLLRLLHSDSLAALEDVRIAGRSDIRFADRVSAALLERIGQRRQCYSGLQLPVSWDGRMLANQGLCPRLRWLSLGMRKPGRLPLSDWPALEELRLQRCGEHWGRLALSGDWPGTLRKVVIDLTINVTPEEPALLSDVLASQPRPILYLVAGIDGIEGVRHLDRLAGLAVTSTGLFGLEEADLSHLRQLTLYFGAAVDEAPLLELLRSPTLGRLRSLTLSGRPVGREAIQALVSSPTLGRLRELVLAGPFEGEGLRLLADWPGLAGLDRLELTAIPPRAPGGDDSAELARSVHLSRLTRLSLCGISLPEPVRQLFRDRLGWRGLV